MMIDAQQEQYEYDKFMKKLAEKIHEISEDYNKLSKANQYRIKNEAERLFNTASLKVALKHVSGR